MDGGHDGAPVSREDVLALVMNRVQVVFELPPERVSRDSRFFDDLQADSLDLVEVVESVERALGDRGIDVALRDEQLLSLSTVQDAADAIADAAHLPTADATGLAVADATGPDRVER